MDPADPLLDPMLDPVVDWASSGAMPARSR
jgi:hypothetical protein